VRGIHAGDGQQAAGRAALHGLLQAAQHANLAFGHLEKILRAVAVHMLHHIRFRGLTEIRLHHLHVAEVIHHPRFDAIAGGL
jgi:hypothetical protein